MKIAVNTRLLLNDKLEGIGWFTYETLKRIVRSHPEHEFFFIFDRPFSRKFIFSSNVTPFVLNPPARHPLLWEWWFEFSIPRLFRKIHPDVFISPDGYLSLSSDVKSIPVIHDLNFEHYPKQFSRPVKNYLLSHFPKFARKADRIVTVSEYSKYDISKTYNIPAHRIDVVYNGANSIYKPLTPAEKSAARLKFAGGCPYFIYIGALLPRKNISKLLMAFEKFKRAEHTDVKLILVGSKMFNTKDIDATLRSMKYRSEVIFTGHLPSGMIEFALGGAIALTYVSYFEGFGIPIIEAMNAEIPVITSNITSMPEIAGEAAVLANPFSIESIQNALSEVYNDPSLCEKLIRLGRKQRQKFSWELTSGKFWQSILKCQNL